MPNPIKESLFTRLGGADAIHSLVEGMYAKILSDPKLSDFFKKSNMDKQKDM